ncbi:MAG: gluconate 2-dehydrogenase subunit 3 family protein [Chitinophagaceae bacterium]|nr:gluconate 2-dehydrogenase subunit 3 family protein [Chitinophagaceae bacterium]
MINVRDDHYPNGTVQALMQTDNVTANTRNVLQNRIDRKYKIEPEFFDAEIFQILRAVCMRLIPQINPDRMVDLAGCLDGILAEGKGNGWRYDAMPEDGKAFMTGLYGIDKSAVLKYQKNFHLLTANEQDLILASVQSGEATGLTWDILPAKLFFEELLAALVELYYSHPFAKEDIGEVAMADAKGWQKIGLNQLEAYEPKIVKAELYATP